MAAGKSNSETYNWYDLKLGQFNKWNREAKQNDHFAYLTGKLQRLDIVLDEGNGGSVRPYDVARVFLKDDDGTVEVAKIALRTEAGIGLGCRVHHLKLGDEIRLNAYGSDDNEKISFLSVRLFNPTTGEYELLDRAPWATSESGVGKDTQKQNAEAAIREHPAFQAKEPEGGAEESNAPKAEGQDGGSGTKKTADANPAGPGGDSGGTSKPAAKNGKTPVSAERNRYFDVIDELGLKDLGVNDHRDMVAKIMGMADFGKVDPASVKSFNDVDDKAVAWFTDWLLSQKEAIVAGPSHPKFDKLPAKIRTLIEAKFNQGQKPAGTPPVEDADPFEGE